MHRAIYDTRFFIEFFYSKDAVVQKKLKNEKNRKDRYVSTIVIHEIYKLSLAHEGLETAKLRAALIKKYFKVIPVDDQIAQISAELRHKYNLSMGESMIVATASILKAHYITDDPHFTQITEIQTSWR